MSEDKKYKKTPTKKLIYLSLCGIGIVAGIGFLIGYMLSFNMVLAIMGVLLGGPGVLGGWYVWKMDTGIFTKDIHKKEFDEKANTICHYRHDIVMQHIDNPPGHLIEFANAKEKLYQAFFDGEYGEKGLQPQQFRLPDKGVTGITPSEMARDFVNQKEVTAFIQKKKAGSKNAQIIKRGTMVVVIIILWILIVTTTT